MMMFFRKRRPSNAVDPIVERLQARHFPRITRERRADAIKRLAAEREKHITVDWGDGPTTVCTGTIDLRDVQAESGYGAWISGYDRFGWPAGHPDSPATDVG